MYNYNIIVFLHEYTALFVLRSITILRLNVFMQSINEVLMIPL